MTLSPIPTLRRADLDLPADVRARLDSDLRAVLLPVAARYLTTLVRGRVADPVANFHLSNGALVDALRWRANTEDYGLDRSWGVMASYRYDPDRFATNAAAYAAGEAVATSDEVRALAGR